MRGLLVLIPGLFSGLPITDSQVDDNDRKQQKLIHKKLTLLDRPRLFPAVSS